MNGESCDTCRHFAVHLQESVDGAMRSECRRYPPAFTSAEPGVAVFPIVQEADYCGEYRARQLRPMADSQAPQFVCVPPFPVDGLREAA